MTFQEQKEGIPESYKRWTWN